MDSQKSKPEYSRRDSTQTLMQSLKCRTSNYKTVSVSVSVSEKERARRVGGNKGREGDENSIGAQVLSGRNMFNVVSH